MKHILMACGTGVCTSSAVRDRVRRFLDSMGYAGKYDVTQCRMADVPALSPTHDFLVAVTLLPGTLDIPFVNGVPFPDRCGCDRVRERAAAAHGGARAQVGLGGAASHTRGRDSTHLCYTHSRVPIV